MHASLDNSWFTGVLMIASHLGLGMGEGVAAIYQQMDAAYDCTSASQLVASLTTEVSEHVPVNFFLPEDVCT